MEAPRGYDNATRAECERMFVFEHKSARQIAAIYNNRPTSETVRVWADTLDADKRTWYDKRRDFLDAVVAELDPDALHEHMLIIAKQKVLQFAATDPDAAFEALNTINKAREKHFDERHLVELTLRATNRLIDHLRAEAPSLLTDKLLGQIRAFVDDECREVGLDPRHKG